MIDAIFVQAPEYQDYINKKEEISNESVVLVEEVGMEKFIAKGKEYNFIPSNGTTNTILTQTENGPAWKFAFWTGTASQYENLPKKDQNTFYFILED